MGHRQASITSIIGDTFLYWRVVSGPTRWSPKKAPPKSLHSTGTGCKNGPRVATCWGPPPYPLSLLAEQVLTFETKGSLGRAFVINLESESLAALAKQYCLDLPPMHDRRALCSTNLRTLVHGNWKLEPSRRDLHIVHSGDVRPVLPQFCIFCQNMH